MTPRDAAELREWLAAHIPTRWVMPPHDFQASADDLLAALDEAGIALVPKEPTAEMRKGAEEFCDNFGQDRPLGLTSLVRAAIAASPYRRKP